MCLQTFAVRGIPTREDRLCAIGDLHSQLNTGFGELCEFSDKEEGATDPARLHRLMDHLIENVGGLTRDSAPAAWEDRFGLTPEAVGPNANHSITAMLERLSGLVDSTREASLSAAAFHDWGLTDELSELARRFEESLWFMVVSIHDGLNAATNDRPESGSKT